MIRLLGGERISTIYLTVVTRYRIAMDKQTDGETFATAYTNACIAVKTTPCPRKNCNTIRCHDTGKQCRILTKFYNNTETLKVKQVAKFQQNRSTSATATASLVRSLKSISVHYRHRRDCQVCVRANGKTPAHLKSVFKMSTVCTKSNASSKTWTPLPDHFIDNHLVEMFPLFDQVRLQLVDVTWLRYTRSCSFHQIW